jgi:hypothetical protein
VRSHGTWSDRLQRVQTGESQGKDNPVFNDKHAFLAPPPKTVDKRAGSNSPRRPLIRHQHLAKFDLDLSLDGPFLLVSVFRDLQQQGKALEQAMVEGALLQLRPILMIGLMASLGQATRMLRKFRVGQACSSYVYEPRQYRVGNLAKGSRDQPALRLRRITDGVSEKLSSAIDS